MSRASEINATPNRAHCQNLFHCDLGRSRMMTVGEEVLAYLETFKEAVRARNYHTGRYALLSNPCLRQFVQYFSAIHFVAAVLLP